MLINESLAADEPDVVIGSREQLLHLLAEASEIEHSLMCSYLYAAFSLKRAGEEGLSEAQGDAVERWRKAIMAVAIQEMGHLLLVANLTVAVGGAAAFRETQFPVSTGYFPSGVVVRLSGFSAETLDHFIFLERPRGVEGDDAADYDQDDYARDQARPGLMPSAQDYETIGHLYEAIRQNLRALSRRLGEAALFIGGREAQIGEGIVDLEGVATIGSLDEALEAIDLIVEQGEGSPADRKIRTIAASAPCATNIKASATRTRHSRPPGRWPTIRCCAVRRSRTTRSSSTIPGPRGCSTSPAPPTDCCCGFSASPSRAPARRPPTISARCWMRRSR